MTTDENILKEMSERVTNPTNDTVDNLAVQMFCMIVQSNSSLVAKAQELIVEKMHSNNTTEAARAIGLLEECMSKGGLEFQKRASKFTFLNELIALVLDKHKGPPAPLETKKRIMDCLMLWTVEHQDKLKIQEAYDNLKKQVNFSHGPSTGNPNSSTLTNVGKQRSSILGRDDELVAKLLKQGGEENYKKANLLIKHRFNQEASRTEFICHLKTELKKVENTMKLLDEMLNSYSSDAPGTDSPDIMQDLYNICRGHNEQMARWPDFLGDAEPEFLEDVLNTKDSLMIVLHRYKEVFESNLNLKREEIATKPSAPKGRPVSENKTNTDLLAELLGDAPNLSNQRINPSMTNSVNPNNTMDQLSEIFGNITDNTSVVYNKPQHPSELLGNVDLLEPIIVFDNGKRDVSTKTKSSASTTDGKEIKKPQAFKELKEIDKLSEEMFKQSLKEEQRLTFKKETGKLCLNDLAKDKIQTSQKLNLASGCPSKTQLPSFISESKVKTPINDFAETIKDLKEKENAIEVEKCSGIQEKQIEIVKDNTKKEMTDGSSLPQKPLAEINVDLDDVIPLDEGQRLLLDDDDIQVTLNFTADHPSENVSVIVMTVTNKSKLPVKDFQFEASVKKPCKIRLLPPTDVDMAPSKTFRPSAPINQIVLLLNPTQKPVDIVCIVGYKLGDDPDPIKESIVAKSIPYVC